MKHLENMVEEKGIEPSTFALRRLPQAAKSIKSTAYGIDKRPKTVISGDRIARSVHTDLSP